MNKNRYFKLFWVFLFLAGMLWFSTNSIELNKKEIWFSHMDMDSGLLMLLKASSKQSLFTSPIQYIPPKLIAPVAQLDRASDCGSGGQRFESSRVRHLLSSISNYL